MRRIVAIRAIKSALVDGGYRNAALLHFDLVLRAARLPAFVPRQWRIDYDAENRTLLVEHRYPPVADAEILQKAQGKKAVLIRRVSKSIRKELIAQLQASLSLFLTRLLAESDCST